MKSSRAIRNAARAGMLGRGPLMVFDECAPLTAETLREMMLRMMEPPVPQRLVSHRELLSMTNNGRKMLEIIDAYEAGTPAPATVEK